MSCWATIRNSRFLSCAFWLTIDRKIVEHILKPEICLLDIELARFDLREVEDVVDDPEQRMRGRLHLG